MEAKKLLEKDADRRLWISRVPKATKEEFIKFAEVSFEDDFGMALKHIWDSYKERAEIEILAEMLIEHDERLNSLEGNTKEESKGIKLLGGKRIEKGE